MAFWDDAKNKVMQAIRPRQQEDNQVISNRADGGFSGYVPKMNRPQQDVQATGYQQPGPAGMENMMPTGVDPSLMQGFQPVGGQTGQMPPQGAQPQQGMPRPQAQFQGQPMQPPMNAAQPMGQPMQQGPRPGFGQPAFQQNAPQQGYTSKFQQQPPMGQPMGGAQPTGAPSSPWEAHSRWVRLSRCSRVLPGSSPSPRRCLSRVNLSRTTDTPSSFPARATWWTAMRTR